MRLIQIHLAGFKSFVDPTTIQLTHPLTGVIGPNGCGKSNIIDAVRWVMGESSAKHLRGEAMADVVFNGSQTRKAAEQAIVELHFDNSDGHLGGAYANYATIVIRRQINATGQSTYYLNGSVCRRRDIADIFFGTGLGSRHSYAIIAQGDISRLIEARPEELRVYLEEAAGISKYKERRRETELRLQHTRTNLARLTDVEQELQRQLQHLAHQVSVAEKYQRYETKMAQLQQQLIAWRALQLQQNIADQKNNLTEIEQQFTAIHTQWQVFNEQYQTQQQKQSLLIAAVDRAQADFYQNNALLEKTQHTFEHQQQQMRQWQQALAETNVSTEQLQQELANQEQQFATITQKIAVLAPKLTETHTALLTHQTNCEQIENTAREQQIAWEQFQQQALQHHRQADAQQVEVQLLAQQQQVCAQRLQMLEQEIIEQPTAAIDPRLLSQITAHETAIAEAQQIVDAAKIQRHELQQQQQQQQIKLHKTNTDLQTLRGQLASVQTLQTAALETSKVNLSDWLKQQQLAGQPHVVETIKVAAGWETAVEIVLDHYLKAICVKDCHTLLRQSPPAGTVLVNIVDQHETAHFSPEQLLAKLTIHRTLWPLLQSIYIAEDISEAQQLLTQLPVTASVVTRTGVWLSHDWLRMPGIADAQSGVIERERTLRNLRQLLAEKTQQAEEETEQLQQTKTVLQDSDNRYQQQQQHYHHLTHEHTNLRAELKVQQARYQQQEAQQLKLVQDSEILKQQLAQTQQQLAEQQMHYQLLLSKVVQDDQARTPLRNAQQQGQENLQQLRTAAQTLQQQTYQYQTQQEVLVNQQQASETRQQQLIVQHQAAVAKQTQLQQQITESTQALQTSQQQLQVFSEQQQQAEHQLTTVRQQFSDREQALQTLAQQQHACELMREQQRSQLEQQRLALQAEEIAYQNVMAQAESDIVSIQQTLSDNFVESAAATKLQQYQQKMARLEPINRAAIHEHTEILTRKNYLAEQQADILAALTTLEVAIRKIDDETRERFKMVYDQVNRLFQQLFPQIFGGGSAALHLTQEDLLQAGVAISARPPGKRNANIHLLSGGEKALTAIALVFALFQLNPAPFCLLDEVDAPLDDANVVRFCQLVKTLSHKVQFIFITHNKLAMEMGEHLLGVTMQEPGVSRIVAVDVQAALALAEA